MSDPIYEIKKCEAAVIPILSVSHLEEELTEQAKAHDLHYLLAFALDGLFWGRFDGETWHKKSPSTSWDEQNVQEVRIFGENGEVHLWRGGEGWIGRKIIDGAGDDFEEMICDQQILWGDTVEDHKNGFTLLADGQQGLRHWLPIHVETQHLASPASKKETRSIASLRVRHYLAKEEDVARIAVTRLVSLSAEPNTARQHGVDR